MPPVPPDRNWPSDFRCPLAPWASPPRACPGCRLTRCSRRTADVAEPKRRAAAGAECALRDRGTAERARRAARPGKVLRGHIGPGTERPADRLLTHPAMADAGALR